MGDAVRKRRDKGRSQGSTFASSQGELEEPLLSPEDRSEEHESSSDRDKARCRSFRAQGRSDQALVPHSINRVNWEELWRLLWANCCSSWSGILATISSCLAPLLPEQLRPVQLSSMQAARLNDLRTRIEVPFDADNPEHVEGLKRLWEHAFPGVPWQGVQADKWVDMGWQRNDPSSDFRGAGLIALHNHLHMAQEQPRLFRRLLDKAEGTRASWEYPFAVAGVNLTYMLEEVFDLRDKRVGSLIHDRLPGSAAGRSFLSLLAGSSSVFESVYCMAFEVLDREWLDMKASYMDFPAVMARVQAQLVRALSAQPGSLAELRRLLALTTNGAQ
ncbi:probable engulfment and cell motility protein 3 [Coccomyxa sp. Obi]|nr:probable engulfment and cell motility protein 3 [Coccomyxa sp. Obi]